MTGFEKDPMCNVKGNIMTSSMVNRSGLLKRITRGEIAQRAPKPKPGRGTQ
jgi:hypothetical protein